MLPTTATVCYGASALADGGCAPCNSAGLDKHRPKLSACREWQDGDRCTRIVTELAASDLNGQLRLAAVGQIEQLQVAVTARRS